MEKQEKLIDDNKDKIHISSTIPLKNIRKLKEFRGLSYSQIAKETGLGYSREYICKILHGDIMPKPEMKRAIAEYFHVEPLKVAWGIKDSEEEIDEDTNTIDE